MADTKTSALAAIPAVDGADVLPIVDATDTTTKKVSVTDLAAASAFTSQYQPLLDISATAPVSPTVKDLWVDSDDLALYVYYDNGGSPTFAAIGGPAGPTGATGPPGSTAVATVTETTDTLAAGDDATLIQYTAAGAVTVTLANIATGFECVLMCLGAGGLSVAAGGMSFANSFTPKLTIAQGEALYVKQTAASTFVVLGGTAT
jgi:hypothetical protein